VRDVVASIIHSSPVTNDARNATGCHSIISTTIEVLQNITRLCFFRMALIMGSRFRFCCVQLSVWWCRLNPIE